MADAPPTITVRTAFVAAGIHDGTARAADSSVLRAVVESSLGCPLTIVAVGIGIHDGTA